MSLTTQSSSLATVPPNTVIATESIGGAEYQVMKPAHGIAGAATVVSSAAPLPVRLDYTGLNSTPLSVALTSGALSLGSVVLTSGTQTIGTVLLASESIVIGSVTLTSGTQTIGTVLNASGTQTIGTVAVSSGSVLISSGTQVIGSVSPSSIWTVTLSSGSQTIGTVINTSGTQVIGSVMPSSIWTVTPSSGTQTIGTVAVSSGAVLISSGSQTIGTVINASGTQVIGSVQPSSIWTVSLSSGTQVIGSVSPSSIWTVTPSSGTQTIGTVAVSSGAVLISSGTQTIGTVQAAGDVANAASDSGNPVKIGGIAKTTNPTAVTDAQRVNALFDKAGKLVSIGGLRDLKANLFTTSSSTVETAIVTAGGASTFADLYGLVIANIGTVAVKSSIKDSSGGSTILSVYIPAGDTRGFMLPVDSAMAQTTSNKTWTSTLSSSTAQVEITTMAIKNL